MPLRQTIETLLVRAALRIVPRLPRPAVLGMARLFGSAAYVFSRHLRQVGRVNLDIAFGPTKSDSEKQRILRSSFRSFALMMLDTFWFSRKARERIDTLVKFEPGFECLLQPKAQICVTGHLGNWEILGISFSMKGYPLTSVAAPLDNEVVDEMFNGLRRLTGQRVVSKHGALRPLLRTLRAGDKVALLLDQNTKPVDGGVFVQFFGKPAPVSSAAAALALRTDAEVYTGACIPCPDGTYKAITPKRVEAPPTDGAHEADRVQAFTQNIATATENLVRAYPEYWLWSYKRWKYVAPGLGRDEFPFYSKELRPADR